MEIGYWLPSINIDTPPLRRLWLLSYTLAHASTLDLTDRLTLSDTFLTAGSSQNPRQHCFLTG